MPEKSQKKETNREIIEQGESPVTPEGETSAVIQKEPDLLEIEQKLTNEAFAEQDIPATGHDTCGDLKTNTTVLEISGKPSEEILCSEKDVAETATNKEISDDLSSVDRINIGNGKGIQTGTIQEISEDLSSTERIDTGNRKDVETRANQQTDNDLSSIERIDIEKNEEDLKTNANQDISNDLLPTERIDTGDQKDVEAGANPDISDDRSSVKRIESGNERGVETKANPDISNDRSSIERTNTAIERGLKIEANEADVPEDLLSTKQIDIGNQKNGGTGANQEISKVSLSAERIDTGNEKDVETGADQEISDDLKKALSLSFFEINEKSLQKKIISDSKLTGLPRSEPAPDYNNPNYRGAPPQQQQYQQYQQYPYQSNQQQPYNQTPQYQQRLDGQVIYVLGPAAPPPQNLQRDQRERVVQVNRNQYGMSSDEQIFVRSAFDDRKIRNRFVQRVYAILAVQLMYSFLFICLVTFTEEVWLFVRTYWGLALMAMFLYLIVVIVLVCCAGVRRQVPTNFIMLGLLTFLLTYAIAFLTTMYATFVVMASIGMTTVICTLVSLFAMTTKLDITSCGMCLCICMICLMLFGLVAMIISFFIRIPIVFLVYSCLACLLFIMFLMYDTQQIVGGKRFELSPEEYIYGALTLYIDIMYIFMYIMAICGFKR